MDLTPKSTPLQYEGVTYVNARCWGSAIFTDISVMIVSSRTIELRRFFLIPSAGVFRPTVIDKSWPIESIESRLRDQTRTFARPRSASPLPAEGIELRTHFLAMPIR